MGAEDEEREWECEQEEGGTWGGADGLGNEPMEHVEALVNLLHLFPVLRRGRGSEWAGERATENCIWRLKAVVRAGCYLIHHFIVG